MVCRPRKYGAALCNGLAANVFLTRSQMEYPFEFLARVLMNGHPPALAWAAEKRLQTNDDLPVTMALSIVL